jgi:hypothetical protein
MISYARNQSAADGRVTGTVLTLVYKVMPGKKSFSRHKADVFTIL